MSTIKSSDEHLTLNADGSSKEIKFQCNGTEVAKIDSTGFVNAGATSLNGLSDATTSDDNNIGIGSNAVDSITTGDNNVGVGVNTLTAVTDGNKNVAVGTDTLKVATSVPTFISISPTGDNCSQSNGSVTNKAEPFICGAKTFLFQPW